MVVRSLLRGNTTLHPATYQDSTNTPPPILPQDAGVMGSIEARSDDWISEQLKGISVRTSASGCPPGLTGI